MEPYKETPEFEMSTEGITVKSMNEDPADENTCLSCA